MSNEVNYRQQWAEGEIEAGTLLDAIDLLEHEKELMCQSRGVAAYERDKARTERDAALAELAALKGGREAVAVVAWPAGSGRTGGFHSAAHDSIELEPGTKLYALPPLAGQVSVPDVCDGREQEAFEAFAKRKGMDTSMHPLHWLFLNRETYAARQGWKAAIRYCRALLATPSMEVSSNE